MDVNIACILFNIGIRLYLESGLGTGKVIVVDEAHKVRLVYSFISYSNVACPF